MEHREQSNASLDQTAASKVTRRQIVRAGLAAGTLGLLASLAVPESASADHYGCRHPAGTGDPAPGFNPPVHVQEQFKKAYCLYKNGTGVPQRDLGVPWNDRVTGRVHLWNNFWNQNFINGGDYTNLMRQPADGRAYRNYGPWLDKLMQRSPAHAGAPINDPHEWWGGTIQDRRGGLAGDTAFMRRREGGPVYDVHGGWWHKFLQVGGPPSFGYPTSDEQWGRTSAVTGARTQYQLFERGGLQLHVTGSRAGLIVEVHGAIRSKWEEMGAGGSKLGLPISDEHDARFGRISNFENGFIYWHQATNRTFVLPEFNYFDRIHEVLRQLPDREFFFSVGKAAAFVGVYVEKYGIDKASEILDRAIAVVQNFWPNHNQINRSRAEGRISDVQARGLHYLNGLILAVKLMVGSYAAPIQGYYDGLVKAQEHITRIVTREHLRHEIIRAETAQDEPAADAGRLLDENYDALSYGWELTRPASSRPAVGGY